MVDKGVGAKVRLIAKNSERRMSPSTDPRKAKSGRAKSERKIAPTPKWAVKLSSLSDTDLRRLYDSQGDPNSWEKFKQEVQSADGILGKYYADKRTMTLIGDDWLTSRLDNCLELHPDNKNWANFLKGTDLKEEKNGWKHYVSSNGHYIVSPTGEVKVYYGYSGNSAFVRLSESGLVGRASKSVPLNWDDLHIQSREEILSGAGMQTELAAKKWADLDTWVQGLLKDSLTRRSKGKAKIASASDVVELQSIEDSRSSLSKSSDERQEHSLIVEPDDPKVDKWLRDQGSMDVRGIDTPRRGKVKKTARRAKRSTRSTETTVRGLRK